MLLADMDGVFATGVTTSTGTYSTGTNTWDFSLNITDMQYVTFAKIVSVDTTPPVISNPSIASGTLIPTGTFSYSFSYADTGSAINTGSVDLGIYSWNTGSSTWNVTDLAGTYATLTSATSSTGTFQITGLPFGKYRFDQIVSDTSANQVTQSTTLFVDAITWTISAPLYDIGGGQTNITSFGSGELIITMQTV